jgi:FixJ family two-component response regulator
VARAHGKGIDLLLADIVMPQMSGTELAEALLQDHPACRVLLMTGYPADARVATSVQRGGAVLYKPFRPSQLLEHVERVLQPG